MIGLDPLAFEVKGAVIGIGIDAVDVPRFRRVLARRATFSQRHFTDDERSDANQMEDPTERLAARFAAKEAVMKALGSGIGTFALTDIEVVRAGGVGATRWSAVACLDGKAWRPRWPNAMAWCGGMCR